MTHEHPAHLYLHELVASGALTPTQAERLLAFGRISDIEAMVRAVGVRDDLCLLAAAVAWGIPPAPSTALDASQAERQRDALRAWGVPLDHDFWARHHATPCVLHGGPGIAFARAASTEAPPTLPVPWRSVLALPGRVQVFRDAVCPRPAPTFVMPSPPPPPSSPTTPIDFQLPRRPSQTLQDPLQSGRWLVLEPAMPTPASLPGLALQHAVGDPGELDFSRLAEDPLPAPPPLLAPPPSSVTTSPMPLVPSMPAPAPPSLPRTAPLTPVAAPSSPSSVSSPSSPPSTPPSAPPSSSPSPSTWLASAPDTAARPAWTSTLPLPLPAPPSDAAERTTAVHTGRITLADLPRPPASDTAPATTSMAVLVGRPLTARTPVAPAPSSSSSPSAPAPATPTAHDGSAAARAVDAAVRQELTGDTGPAIGDWVIERSLGAGASADVYLAVRHGQRAALKLLRIDGATAEEQRARFTREGNVVARLTHHNVVRLLDRGITDGTPWLVCEYVDGGSVADLMARTGPMPVVLATRIICDVLRGLSSAHREGVVHRDMKPGNLLLTRAGVCKVADFGIAKTDDNLTLTQEGVAYGTPAYMSPEQASGQPIDHRSDLFGVGTIFWHLLTGQNPFSARTVPGTLVAVSRAQPGDLLDVAPWVPVGVARVVETLLARHAGDRYASADLALEALQPMLDWIEFHEPQVIARALATPVDVVNRLRREQATLEERQARAALARRPPMRHEAALARRRSLLLAPDADVAATQRELCAQHRYHLHAPRLDELPDVVRAVGRSEEAPALLRRAGLAHFDAGNLVESSYFLRRFLAWGGTPDEAVASRLRALQGQAGFAPFELSRAQRGEDVATPPPVPPTERLDRVPELAMVPPTSPTLTVAPSGRASSSPPMAAPPSSSSPLPLAMAAAAVVGLLGLGGGILLGGRASPPTTTTTATTVEVGGMDEVERGRLLRDARAAIRKGDTGAALALLEKLDHEARDSAEAATASLLAGGLYGAAGDVGRARRALLRVVDHPAARAEDIQEARAALAALP